MIQGAQVVNRRLGKDHTSLTYLSLRVLVEIVVRICDTFADNRIGNNFTKHLKEICW